MADVTVRGAGVIGLSIAWACARRGASVKVIDPDGAGSGASGGIVGALAPHVPEFWNAKKAFQLDALLMADSFWGDVERAGGSTTGFARTGRLQPLEDQAAIDRAEDRAKQAVQLWQGKAVWEILDAPEDWGPISPTDKVIHDTLSARIHPRAACAALVAALWRKGIAVTTTGDDSGAVVHATGWRGMMELSERLGRAVGNGVKGQAALLDYDAAGMPQVFAEGVHIIPHADGTTAIGSTTERDWIDETSTDIQLSAVIAAARRAVPALAKAKVIERWAGVRPRAKSRGPMLGAHPLHDGQFIANGGFKIGLGLAPKIAEVMATRVLDQVDTIPDEFRPEASGA